MNGGTCQFINGSISCPSGQVALHTIANGAIGVAFGTLSGNVNGNVVYAESINSSGRLHVKAWNADNNNNYISVWPPEMEMGGDLHLMTRRGTYYDYYVVLNYNNIIYQFAEYSTDLSLLFALVTVQVSY